jgi:hypothetical protein
MNESASDSLIGKIVGERFEIQEFSETQVLGHLYRGIDVDAKSVVGILVTPDALAHKRLQEWLGKAVLTRGKDCILAAGHINAQQAFVVFAEIALDYLREPLIEAPTEEKPKPRSTWQRLKFWEK